MHWHTFSCWLILQQCRSIISGQVIDWAVVKLRLSEHGWPLTLRLLIHLYGNPTPPTQKLQLPFFAPITKSFLFCPPNSWIYTFGYPRYKSGRINSEYPWQHWAMPCTANKCGGTNSGLESSFIKTQAGSASGTAIHYLFPWQPVNVTPIARTRRPLGFLRIFNQNL